MYANIFSYATINFEADIQLLSRPFHYTLVLTVIQRLRVRLSCLLWGVEGAEVVLAAGLCVAWPGTGQGVDAHALKIVPTRAPPAAAGGRRPGAYPATVIS
jgi:hypothetical protein